MQGELVEATGVMSGGGTAKRGAMGDHMVEDVSDEQIQEVTAKLAQAESKA